MKHMPTFHASEGIAPQIDVPTNITADSKIEALRPRMSAMMPQTIEPTTLPVSAANENDDAVGLSPWYSAIMPGRVKRRLAGFMMSMMTAITSTDSRIQWARLSG